MAHRVKFAVVFAFCLLGLYAFVTLPVWQGALAFFGFAVFGSLAAQLVFKRTASSEEIREDLEARVRGDRFRHGGHHTRRRD